MGNLLLQIRPKNKEKIEVKVMSVVKMGLGNLS